MKSIFRLLSLLLAAVLLFSACRSDEEASVSFSNSDIQLDQQQNYANFEIKSNTQWSLQCFAFDTATNQYSSDEEILWFSVNPTSGLGSQIARLDVLSYNSDVDTRYGYIVVTSADNQIDTIVVSQATNAKLRVYVNPDTIYVPATGKIDCGVNAYATSRSAHVEIIPMDRVDMLDDGVYSYENMIEEHTGNLTIKRLPFIVKPNEEDAERRANFDVRVTLGDKFDTTMHVVVIQSASSMPSIKTNSSVFLLAQSGATSVIPVSIEGTNFVGDVDYKFDVPISCDWIRADFDGSQNDYITVKSKNANPSNAAREGYFTVSATVGANVVSTTVRVIQAGTGILSKCVLPATSSVTADHYAQSLFLPYTLRNASLGDVKVFSGYSWIKNLELKTTGLVFDVEKFDDSDESYREGVIYIITTDATYGDAVAQISVRQYSSRNVDMLVMPSSVIAGKAAHADSVMLPASLKGKVSVVSTSAAWLDAEIEDNQIKITTAENTGALRDGYITLNYTLGNAVYTFNVLVRQLNSAAPTLGYVIYHNEDAESLQLPVGASSFSQIRDLYFGSSVSSDILKVDFTSINSGSRSTTIVLSDGTVCYPLRVVQIHGYTE